MPIWHSDVVAWSSGFTCSVSCLLRPRSAQQGIICSECIYSAIPVAVISQQASFYLQVLHTCHTPALAAEEAKCWCAAVNSTNYWTKLIALDTFTLSSSPTTPTRLADQPVFLYNPFGASRLWSVDLCAKKLLFICYFYDPPITAAPPQLAYKGVFFNYLHGNACLSHRSILVLPARLSQHRPLRRPIYPQHQATNVVVIRFILIWNLTYFRRFRVFWGENCNSHFLWNRFSISPIPTVA